MSYTFNDSLYKLHLTVIRVKGIVWVLICLRSRQLCWRGETEQSADKQWSRVDNGGARSPTARSRSPSRICPHLCARQTKPPAAQGIFCIPSVPHFRHTLHLSGWLFITLYLIWTIIAKYFDVWRWEGSFHGTPLADDPTIAFISDLNDDLK